jgi:DNA-binding CsgD family transcriptional regulator
MYCIGELMESCPTCHKVRTPRFKERLSPREVEVFILTVQGKQSKVIADVLCVHEKTVKFHLTNIYKKTATKNRGELISGWFQRTLREEVVSPVHVYLPTHAEAMKKESAVLPPGTY